jgi:integrase
MPRRNSGARLRFLDKRRCFYIVWTENGRSRERSTGTADRQVAEIALAEFIHRRTRGAGPCEPGVALVTDILADYAQDHAQETNAPWRIGAAIKGLVPFWQGRTVSDVNRDTCRAYASKRERSGGTVRRELGVLRAAINHAYRNGRITRAPAVHLPPRPDPRDRWLSQEEAARLIAGALGFSFARCTDLSTRKERWVIWDRERAHARLHLPLFILLGLYTGARKQAILSLRWTQVDLKEGRIDFNVPGARRTNKRRGHIPIPMRLLAHLRRARLRGSELGFVVNENGNRLAEVKRGFASACRRAGLDDVTPHVLRHTCATWLMQRGVPMWEAAGFLAMTRETLERVYGHHHPGYLRSAVEALG